MICAPIETGGPRFYVSSIEGYPINSSQKSAGAGGGATSVLVCTVIDSFYGSEHGRYASNDAKARGEWIANPGWGYRVRRGRGGALAAAAERCAELNAWHEREGWGE